MRISLVRVDTVDIPFREPIVSGAHQWENRRVAVLTLHTDVGVHGLGEFAAPQPSDLGDAVGPRLVAELEGVHLDDPVTLERSLRRIDAWPFVGRVARSAVESAIVDLLAMAGGRSAASFLAEDPADQVEVNGLVGISDVEVAAQEASSLVAMGYRCLKLKVGDEPVDALLGRLAAVRDAIGSSVAMRLDFNGALSVASALEVLGRLEGIGIDYVEQPIAPTAGIAALARLRKESAVRVAADESVRDLGSARDLLAAGAVDVLVVKPSRVGGLRQASSIVELATEAGAGVTVSTLFETGVGIAGALHLAATVLGGGAHGLATAALLQSDLLVRSLPIADGRMTVPAGPGLGIDLDPDAIERYRVA